MSPAIQFPFILIITSLSFCSLAIAKCHVDDESGLLGFKSAITNDPSGMLRTWKAGTDCCTWAGVECRVENRVTSISIYGQLDMPTGFLTGTISPSLSKLQNLDGLYLQDLQNITGPFPEFIFHLPKLQYAYIQNNGLSGELPKNIGNLAHLEALGLSGNLFTGPIPTSISELTHLNQLKLDGNLFTGQFPPGIGSLKNLTLLSLDHNRLTGSIPDIFSAFSNLRILRISHNKFTGNIPNSISYLASKLAYLELGHNSLHGKIPDFLGNFKALDTLDLSWNRFTGTVPKSFKNLTKIFNLNLSNNFLIDPFPVLDVKGIESLDLSNNRFNLGTIPKWVTSSPIIYSLNLSKCGIHMRLEDWKPEQTYFYDYIDISGNKISGSPVALLNRTDYLVSFRAGSNQLQFDMDSLRLVSKLKEFDLSRNLVFGKLPKWISGLEKLNVSYNHLCGNIPASKFPASSFVGNDCLCGFPLNPCKK